MRLIIDMNLSPRWVQRFQAEGIDAAHWSTVGVPTATDSEIMAYAAEHDCVVFTHDLDFGAILAASHGSKPSVVQVRASNVTPEAIGDQVIAALRQVARELDEGALLTIDTSRSRLRLLPLRK